MPFLLYKYVHPKTASVKHFAVDNGIFYIKLSFIFIQLTQE